MSVVAGGDAAGAASRWVGAADRWARALHDLYLVTLAVASVATAVSFPPGVDWLVAGVAAAALGGADLAVRRRPLRHAPAVGYFLAAGAAVGVVTTVFPMFATVGFGLLPLAFVRLPRWGAVVAGVVTTGLPYVVRPWSPALLHGLGWEPEAPIRIGLAYFAVVDVALPVLTGLFTAGAVQALHRQRTHQEALLAQLSATRAELASASRLAGRAEERQRLAHELHDTLAQGLSGVVLQLEAAEQYLDGDGPPSDATRLAGLVARARETAASYLADTRRAVAALRPEPLDDATLADAVGQLCARWTRLTGVTAPLSVCGDARRFHPLVEVVALRVVQEAMANAGKHADAGEVRVTVEYRASDLRVTVRDDGRGFTPHGTAIRDGDAPGGFGLATMRERVASVGGTMSVASAPGAGTTVTATLPDPTYSTQPTNLTDPTYPTDPTYSTDATYPTDPTYCTHPTGPTHHTGEFQ